MTTDEEEDLIWSCIQPAANVLTPCDSDGYNEGEVYGAVCKAIRKVEELYKERADRWQQLMDKLNKWSEIHEDRPTDQVVADAWWRVQNEMD